MPLDLMMFAALIGGILLGFPVAFTIAGVASAFALIGWALGQFDLSLLGALGQRVFGVLTNDVLIAIPLFVFMGVVLEKSRIAEALLETMARLFGALRGGLGVSVVLVGVIKGYKLDLKIRESIVRAGMFAIPVAYLVQGIVLFDVSPIYLNLFLLFAFATYKFQIPSAK